MSSLPSPQKGAGALQASSIWLKSLHMQQSHLQLVIDGKCSTNVSAYLATCCLVVLYMDTIFWNSAVLMTTSSVFACAHARPTPPVYTIL